MLAKFELITVRSNLICISIELSFEISNLGQSLQELAPVNTTIFTRISYLLGSLGIFKIIYVNI